MIPMDNYNELHKGKLETNDFIKKVKEWGASIAGVGDVSIGLAEEFKHLPCAISLAIAHPPIIKGIKSHLSTRAYSNQFPLIDVQLENIQKRVSSYLRSLGWKTFVIPPDTGKHSPKFVSRLFPLFQHKTGATCAGLGWIGKNGLLVTKRYGARLSWATVLTNAPLKPIKQPYIRGECKGCQRCVNICPAGAISNEEWVREHVVTPKVNAKACFMQLEKNYQVLGSYICGLCIIACPLGSNKKFKGG